MIEQSRTKTGDINVTKKKTSSPVTKKIIDKRRPLTTQDVPSFFNDHQKHHEEQNVDMSSFAAKRLGLTYLGFGRYGIPSKDAKATHKFEVTHIVKNGFLIPVDNKIPQKEGHLFPKRNSEEMWNFHAKQQEALQKAIDKMTDEERVMLDSGRKMLDEYLNKDYTSINHVLFKGMEKYIHPALSGKIRRIDDLFTFDFSKLHSDLVLYTSVDGLKIEKNKGFTFSGYLSLTTDPRVALGVVGGTKGDVDDDLQRPLEHETPAILQLNMKKGQRALNVTTLTGSLNTVNRDDNQDEFILPRNANLTVKDGPIYLRRATVWMAELNQPK